MINDMQPLKLRLPETILDDASYVMSRAEHVTIHKDYLTALGEKVQARLAQGTDKIEVAFGSTGNLAQDANLLFFETAVNFCFWGERDDLQWKVPVESDWIGGWYGLAQAFSRAIAEGIAVHDCRWMAQLSVERAEHIFRGKNRIPLLELRVNNIVESANFLLEKYDGQLLRLLEHHKFSAPDVVEEIVASLPSYRDGAWYKGQWVWIVKRAQILLGDLSQLTAVYPDFLLKDIDKLTAFADYRLPQVLRHCGVLSYDPTLTATIDEGRILPAGSTAEIEIRAATILACKQLQAQLAIPTASVDLGLWLLSQDMRSSMQPCHRTLSYFY